MSDTREPATEWIRIRGARTHNLKNVDLDLPRDRLTVLTGPSGSGKSSLAFDTLFAEGQRQYIESLSTYARQFLTQLERPDVDSIDGLEPTVCIDQRAGRQGPRSTVATVTEIYDYLRLFFARLGDIRCRQCNAPIQQSSLEQIQTSLLALPEGTKLVLLAPVVRGKKGEQPEAFQQIRKAGFVRVRINGVMHDVEQLPKLDPKKAQTIEAVVDRIVVRPGGEGRLAESLQLALKHGDGLVAAMWLPTEIERQAKDRGESTEGKWTERLFSTLYACPDCGIAYEEIEPRTFSFNSPYGACPVCEGIGSRVEFDPDMIVPDGSAPLLPNGIAPWRELKTVAVTQQREALDRFLAANKLAGESAIEDWTPLRREKLFRGDGGDFPGLLNLLEKELATSLDDERREQLETFRGPVTCPECGGGRLRAEARAVFIAGNNICQATALSVDKAHTFFRELQWPADQEPIATPIQSEIVKRLQFLEKVGLNYLTLARPADTLSGGELQRLKLAGGIGSGLVGVCYILDEPSIGLHPRDNDRLIDALRELQQQGNTVIVVEHDEAMMRAADRLVDIGPGAGTHGGRVISQGTPAEVAADEASLTGAYLSGRKRIALPVARRKPTKNAITLEGVTTNNLRKVTATFPLGVFTCVTGVSGSGKSSLVNETLAPALLRKLGRAAPKPGPFTALKGAGDIDNVIVVDQSPIGRSPRSNAATYCGVFDEIRKVFAATKDAKRLGFKAGRFSFNAAGGRCEECQGHGVKKIVMNFLPDIYVTCGECHGGRYNRETLQAKYKGQTIADVLQMSCEAGAEFFRELEHLHRPLASLCDVGLGYLPLGQSATTLSGGEAQRLKLAAELARTETDRTFYILDEPTTGLHFDDVARLLGVLQRLVDRGRTVLVIEHHPDVIRAADWVIDLGPDGGAGGGEIVAVGTPEEIEKLKENFTGRALHALST